MYNTNVNGGATTIEWAEFDENFAQFGAKRGARLR